MTKYTIISENVCKQKIGLDVSEILFKVAKTQTKQLSINYLLRVSGHDHPIINQKWQNT